MRKHRITALLLIVMMIAVTACLAGCGTKEEVTPLDVETHSTEPGTCEIYGVVFPAKCEYWAYMFNAEQLGNGEEWIDLDINCWLGKPELPDEYETKETDGREFYYYNIQEDTGGDIPMWSYVIVIPQPDGEKYIEIRSDFVEKGEKKKADEFFNNVFNRIAFTDDEGHVVCEEYIMADGVLIPADGLKPSQFFFGTVEWEDGDDVISVQVDFDDEAYDEGIEQILAEIINEDDDEDDDSKVTGCGTLEIDGVSCGWYTSAETWDAEESDMMPYMTHVIMAPADDLQTMMLIEYNFDADVDDLSIYDDQVRNLDSQIGFIKAE